MRSATGLRAAHAEFVASRRTMPEVRPLVAASWGRSAAGGASTDGGTLPAVRLHAGELREYRDEHPLAPLLPVFRDLLGEDARDDDYIFAIADVDGTLLWVEGERGVLAAAERMNFVEGAVWTESAAGTNAPGTALAVGRPVQIFGPEHFNTVVQPWSCSAAPIRDPDGRLLGAVDITGSEKVATPHALALVRATARAVEAELARRTAVADGRALRAYAGELDRSGGHPAALLTANGRVLHAADGVVPGTWPGSPPTRPIRSCFPTAGWSGPNRSAPTGTSWCPSPDRTVHRRSACRCGSRPSGGTAPCWRPGHGRTG